MNKEYEYLAVSDAYSAAHGTGRDGIIGRKVQEVLGEAVFRGSVKDCLDRCFGGEVINYRAWFSFRLADPKFMNVTYYPYLDEDGAASGAVLVARDITEYKAAEERLRESEEKYRHLFDNLNDAAFLADVETGLLVETNRQGEVLTGRPRDEIVGMHQSKLHPPDKAEEYRRRFAAHIAQGRAADYDGEVVRKDGSVAPVRISAAPLALGGRGLVLGVFRDMSERRRYGQALVEGKRFTDIVIRSMHDGFTIQDSDLRFVDGNPAFFRMVGFSPGELEGVPPPLPFWSAEENGSVRAAFSAAEAGEGLDHEFVFRRKDGSAFPVIASVYAIRDHEGGVINYCSTIKDITGRKDMEGELLKTQKLESLGRLAGGIAHNFNNLLTGIVGNVSLALLYGPDEKIAGRLREAERACNHAKDLVRQFLIFSKGGAPVKSAVRLENAIPVWCTLVASGSKSRCEVSVAGDLLPVEADEGMLSQAVQNIVLNADQSMPRGGVIRISAFNTDTGPGDRPLGARHVCIRVEDSGMGIPEPELQKVFDPYYTTRPDGSGLGLATAYSIITNHGGFIDARSRPGDGSVFSVYLPASVSGRDAAASPDRPVRKERVLVMDDEEMIRDAVGEILASMGCEVEFAKDGAEAIGMFGESMRSGKGFDLVIMDLTIPAGMGGREAVRHILDLEPGAKVVVSSGYSNDPVMSDHSKYGFAGVIAKPYRAGDMIALVSRLLGR